MPDGLNVKIKSRTLSLQNLNHALADRRELSGRPGAVRSASAFDAGAPETPSRWPTICAISPLFLNNRITYTEADLPQETEAVLLRTAGPTASASPMSPRRCWPAPASPAGRSTASICARRRAGIEPVPHRWLEIDLPGERRVFYDPQYQDFSSRYLVTNLGVAFERIERFCRRRGQKKARKSWMNEVAAWKNSSPSAWKN